MAELPTHARVVIIGGGAVGCSSLYHLARLGWTDALLLERNELTSGSTWHAAGNCPNFSTSWSIMKMQSYSTALYRRLAGETGYAIGYHVTGSVRLAHSRARMDEYRRVVAMAAHQGLDMEVLPPAALGERYPFMELHDLEGGLWDPLDGDIDPAQLTQALAKGARDSGARIQRFCPVTGLARLPGGEWEVTTPQGVVRCEYVVNAAGYRAPDVARLYGRDMPSVVISHQYLVTESIAALGKRRDKLPLLRDPDVSYYLRQERDGLLLGPYEWQATPHWVRADDAMPDDFSFQLWPDDLGRLERYIEDACRRVPILASVGVKKVINGPIPHAPDGLPLIGPAPGRRNLIEACAFTFGIVQAGGAGKCVAEWIVEGETEWDLWSCDPRRYTDYATKSFAIAKAVETYQNEYAVGFPQDEWPAGRPSKTSSLYERLKAKGAMFGARGGWERAIWFPRAGIDDAAHRPSFQRANWFDAVGAECRAVRDAVGVLDLPGFSRFEITGPGSAEWLDGMITGTLPRPGRIGLAYFCTPKGRVLTEMTVTCFAPDHFWLLTAAAALWHDRDWLLAHRPENASWWLRDISADWGALVLAGPRSRDVLAKLTRADLSSGTFPWLSHQPIALGPARGHAVRVNYVGELGWELHMPMADLPAVYDALWQEGAALGLADFGIYAVESMRLEKCYRAWKGDLSLDYSPLAGGLDRFVRLDKPAFIGRERLLAEKKGGPRERFAPLLVDAADADAPYLATVWQGGTRVGLVTSGGYGHRIGKSIALCHIRADLAVEGTRLEIDILGERRPAVVAREPIYDPSNARLKI